MSKKLPKEEQHYQLNKTYNFKDLEAAVSTLNQEYKALKLENAELKQEIKKYEKIFEGQTHGA